jgi:lipoprotein-releasing system permease protein
MIPFELALSLRYAGSFKRGGLGAFLSTVSGAGIALGVAALIIVLSVMNGFQLNAKTHIFSNTNHIEISNSTRRLDYYQERALLARENPLIRSAVPFMETESVVFSNGRVLPVVLTGIHPEQAEGSLRVIDGSLQQLQPGRKEVLLEESLALAAGVRKGSFVTLTLPPPDRNSSSGTRAVDLKVAGIFQQAGANPVNRGGAIVHFSDLQSLLEMPGLATGVRIQLNDPLLAPVVAEDLESRLGGRIQIKDWTSSYGEIFRSLNIEKQAVFIVLSLITLVAAFNVLASMSTVVNARQSEVALLKTLGAKPASILAVFMFQGLLVSLIGMVVGTCFGILAVEHLNTILLVLESVLNENILPREAHEVTKLPTQLAAADVVLVTSFAMMLGVSSTLWPGVKASKIIPGEVLGDDL